MLEYNKTELGHAAKKLGFVRDTLEKVLRLAEILRFVNESKTVGGNIALKGGTAINLALHELPRLSVDLDFDFAHNLPRDEMLAVREAITDTVNRYTKSQGYGLSPKSKYTHSLDSMVYAYKNAAGNNDTIKFEVNYSQRSHVLDTQRRTISAFSLFEPFEAIVYDAIEIYAGKIAALMSRAASRDLFDVYRMVIDGLIPESQLPLLKSAAVFYVSFADDVEEWDFSFERVNQITQHRIRTELLPVLKTGEKFDLPLVRELVNGFLAEHISATDEVREYLEAFKHGEYHPELLFDNPAILDRIANHPMVAWRLRQGR
jgi:predicted nucleotidyltransferase component of viral defense system